MRKCNKCGLEKDLSLYYKDKAFKDGIRKVCKSCDNLKTYRNYKKYDLKKRYDLDIGEYQNMSTDQTGKCAICQKHESELGYKLCVDHCHKTKAIRKLLCKPCNLVIGNSMENVEILKNAIEYLKIYEKSK